MSKQVQFCIMFFSYENIVKNKMLMICATVNSQLKAIYVTDQQEKVYKRFFLATVSLSLSDTSLHHTECFLPGRKQSPPNQSNLEYTAYENWLLKGTV